MKISDITNPDGSQTGIHIDCGDGHTLTLTLAEARAIGAYIGAIEDPLLTVAEIMARYNINKDKIYRAVKAGNVTPAGRASGKTILIPKSDADRMWG